jgi:hypothetical protein
MSSPVEYLETAEPIEPLDRVNRPLDLLLRLVLTLVAVGIVAGAVFIMVKMDDAWREKGGRYLVATGAFVLLIGVDTLLSRLAWRRFLAGLTPASGYQQRASRATLALVFAAVFLFSQALWLP